MFGQQGTDPAAAFLYRLTEKHDLSETAFLVDSYDYLTSLSRLGLSGQLDYVERYLIEKWFQTFKIRVNRFHNSWVGSRASVSTRRRLPIAPIETILSILPILPIDVRSIRGIM